MVLLDTPFRHDQVPGTVACDPLGCQGTNNPSAARQAPRRARLSEVGDITKVRADPPSRVQDWPRLRIGQVSRLLEVETSTLRYWEEVFPQVRPHRRRGQRLYRTRDLDVLTRIKQLLYVDGYTIRGAREVLDHERSAPAGADESTAEPEQAAATPVAESSASERTQSSLEAARRELESILEQLQRPAGPNASEFGA